MKFYLSTTADVGMEETPDGGYIFTNSTYSAQLAAKYGLALETAEFCMGAALDEDFDKTLTLVRNKSKIAPVCILHAPFNELFPSAIDAKASEFAAFRYEQALNVAQILGIRKIIVHSGFAPDIYFESWFLERASKFWKDFVAAHPGDYTLCIENVMEDNPLILRRLIERIDDKHFCLTFDTGHAWRTAKIAPIDWLKEIAPVTDHFHIHNNAGTFDTHSALDDGVLDLKAFLEYADSVCPDASYTVESLDLERSCKWLETNGFI